MSIFKLPVKLLLFPIRKLVKIVTSIRGVPIEILNVFLLGRTLHRYLGNAKGLEASRTEEFQRAFAKAFQQIDLRIARAAVRDVLDSVSSWKSDAKEGAEEIYQDQNASPSDEQITKVEQSARQVSEALDRPELTQVFERFDERFDRLFAG